MKERPFFGVFSELETRTAELEGTIAVFDAINYAEGMKENDKTNALWVATILLSTVLEKLKKDVDAGYDICTSTML